MVDCSSGSGNVIQVKPGTFCYTKEQGNNKKKTTWVVSKGLRGQLEVSFV